MRRIIVAGLLLTCMYSWSQDANKVDSLAKLLETGVDERTSVNIYNQLANEYVNFDSAQAHSYAIQAIEQAKSINYEIGVVTAYVQIGWTLFRAGHYEQAITNFEEALLTAKEYKYDQGMAEAKHGLGSVLCDKGEFDEARVVLEEALEINEKINYTKGLALTYNQIGILSAYRGDYRATLEYFLKALDIQLKRGDEVKIAGNYNNIAIVYEELNEQEKALAYYEKALNINEKLNNKRGLSINYTNITDIYRDLGEYDKAFNYAKQGLEISKEINSAEGISNNLTALALYHREQGQLDLALDYFQQSLVISEERGDPSRVAGVTRQIGETYLLKKQPNKAIKFFQDAKKISSDIGNPDIYQASLGSLAKGYEIIGDYKNAYVSHVRFKEMSDSLISDENNEQIARLEAAFEFDQERDSLAFAQANERAAFEAEILARKNRQQITYIGLAGLFVLALISAYLYITKQRANQELTDLNLEISEQRDNLQKLNRTKTRLFSIIAHDIRGPMSVFIGFSDILIEYIKNNYNAGKDAELKKIRNHLRQASGRLLELMDDMVSWAQKEEGVVPYHPALIDAKKLIDETHSVVEPLAQAKAIVLKIKVEEGMTLWADKNSCKTILRNLVSNAIKFTPEEGTITISSSNSNGHVNISVSDTGIGIPEGKMDELFEITKSKVRNGTNGEKGTGLGLNVVYEFVEMNKGTIHIESEEQKGTTFTIALPRTEL